MSVLRMCDSLLVSVMLLAAEIYSRVLVLFGLSELPLSFPSGNDAILFFFLLKIEIDLGKKCWYHSVFACPILRQQTSESNPPMKLICGHVISRDALNKLTNAGK